MSSIVSNLPLICVAGVSLSVAIRNLRGFKFRIWQVMAAAAVIVVLAGAIGPKRAYEAVDLGVIYFLFGMFAIGQAMHESGYLEVVSYRILGRPQTGSSLLFRFVMLSGLLSAILLNDTIAIIGTPVVIALSAAYGMRPAPLLLALAFSVTIGSVMSPIGNPQNFLIAVQSGLDNPFVIFLLYLGIPTVLNLLVCYAFLALWFKKEFDRPISGERSISNRNPQLLKWCKVSVFMLVALIAARILLGLLAPSHVFPLYVIALAAAAPVLLGVEKKLEFFKRLDWGTLIFFAAMFIVMRSVWDTGFFQKLTVDAHSPGSVMLFSIIVSQFISNVPLVALVMPMMNSVGAGTAALMALAAGSTIAGNVSILGAASNVIIIQCAEKQGKTLTFLQFLIPGVLLTALNVLLYAGWFVFIQWLSKYVQA